MAEETLVVDGQNAREGCADRKVVDVAVGILISPSGAVLMTSRPQGKAYAGFWEFPGGKLEASETVEQALRRELQEEIGVTIGSARIWREKLVDYPHALVRLYFCKVLDWTGALEMREGQAFSWEHLPVRVAPVLAGTVPVLEWLSAEPT
ncbi:MAG: NUDIX domain-containing protein [Hydrogenophaga sp.]